MKKLFLILILFPVILSAQYFSERSAEESFEKSGLFFNSHYLNTFGLENFKNTAVGMIDDPFLNAYLNPAIFPKFKDNSSIFYLDFRGDRTKEKVVSSYVMTDYFYSSYYRPVYDRRWITITRTEPEPTISIGAILNPLKEITDDFYLGATYQMIRREEGYYTSPYWIYTSSYYTDAFSNRAEGLADVPIKDRYSAENEMITDAHLFSAFAGYRITNALSAGIYFNGVVHKRDGGYLNSGSDEFGDTDNSVWENKDQRDKTQDYSHTDFSAGLMYSFSEKFSAGVKLGVLNGEAEQKYNSINRYFYTYNKPSPTTSWSNNFSNYTNAQYWKHDGTTKYFSMNFTYLAKEGKKISGYYKYSNGNEDIKNSSVIMDTSFYQSHWIDNYNNTTNIYDYEGKSSTKDIRYGYGDRKEIFHEAMVNLDSRLTDWSSVTVGIYFGNNTSDINTTEPVTASRFSESHSNSTGTNNNKHDYYTKLDEIKSLKWTHSTEYITIQIPVFLNFQVNDYFGFTIGVNRMMKNWGIDEETIAYFSTRKRTENDVTMAENSFGERYSPAADKITENSTDIYVKLKADISKEFRVNLLLDPETEKLFRISQWWLSFEARF